MTLLNCTFVKEEKSIFFLYGGKLSELISSLKYVEEYMGGGDELAYYMKSPNELVVSKLEKKDVTLG